MKYLSFKSKTRAEKKKNSFFKETNKTPSLVFHFITKLSLIRQNLKEFRLRKTATKIKECLLQI